MDELCLVLLELEIESRYTTLRIALGKRFFYDYYNYLSIVVDTKEVE